MRLLGNILSRMFRLIRALVLDAGGGTGRWAVRMAIKGCRVVLMDSSDGLGTVHRPHRKTSGE
jgi:ubiquinone/menaquinone biosynthesis C-methylase UbiE